MVQTGDLNPHFFRYGSLLIYLCALVDIPVLWSLFSRPDGITALDQVKYGVGDVWTVSHPQILLGNRLLVAGFGVATVAMAAAHARRLAGEWAGVLAAAFLAGLSVHVLYSGVVGNDAIVAALVTTCAYAALRHVEEETQRWLLLSALCSGLAASAKYNAGVSLVLPGLAVLLRRPALWRVALVPALAAIGFLSATPFAVLDLPAFVQDVGREIRHYTVDGHAGETVVAGWPHVRHQLGEMAHELAAWRWVAPLLVAIAALSRARRAWTFLLFPLAYGAAMSGTIIGFHRNWLAMYPFLAIAVGVGGARLVAALPRPVSTVTAAGLALLCGLSARDASLHWASVADPRSAILDQVIASGEPVGVAEELRLHPLDLARLPPTVSVAPLHDLMCGPALRVVVPVGFKTQRAPDWALTSLLPQAARDGERAGGHGFWLDGSDIRLDLLLLDNRPRPSACDTLPSPALSTFIGSKPFPRDEGAVYMVWTGTLTSPALTLPAGRYEAAWWLRGVPAANKWPAWTAEDGRGANASGTLSGEWEEITLPFEVAATPEEPAADEGTVAPEPTLTPVSLTIAFTNDETVNGEDRNLEVHGFAIRGGRLPRSD